MDPETPPADRLIKIREVLHLCGLSRSSLYAHIKKRNFPAPVKLSTHSSAWVNNEVVEWIQARAKLRDTSGN